MAERVVGMASEPIPGRKYLVPCYRAWSHYTKRWYVLPTTGPFHSDPEVGGAGKVEHVHIDWRFISDRDAWDMFVVELRDREEATTCYQFALFAGSPTKPTIKKGNGPASVGERVRTCKRILPEFKTPNKLTPRVEKLCVAKRLNLATMLCPHKGIPLASCPVDSDGCVTCPGHGVKWNLTTGEMVPS